MSRKGQKNLRGQPEMWGELKKPVTMTLTPTSVSGLDAIAHGLGLSRSELVERIGRGVFPIYTDTIDSAEAHSDQRQQTGGAIPHHPGQLTEVE